MTPDNAEQLQAREALRAVHGVRGALLIAAMLSGPPLMSLSFSAIAPVLPAIAAHLGGALAAQWLMTVPAIGLMLGGPLGALLLEPLGPRRLIVLALIGFALGGAVGLYADGLALMLAGRLLLGLSGAALTTGTTWLIAARYDEEQRRRWIARQDALAGCAALLAVLASGALGQAAGWRAPFAIYLIAVPLIACAAAGVPRLPRPASRAAAGEPVATALRHLASLYLLVLLLGGLMLMPSTQVPFALQAIGVEDPAIRSRVIAASAVVAILFAISFPWVRERAGERGTRHLILAGFCVGNAIVSVAPTPAIVALGCACMGLATGLFSPYFTSLIIARTEPRLRARAIGLMFSAIFLSEFLSPAVVLPLRAAFGVQGGFGAVALLLGGGLLASLVRPMLTLSAREEPR